MTVDGEPSSADALSWPARFSLDADVYGDHALEFGPYFFNTASAVAFEEVRGGCGGGAACTYRYPDGTFDISFSTADENGPAELTVSESVVTLTFSDRTGDYAVDFEVLEVLGYY